MWIDIEQNTDEWLDLRVGRLGGGKGGIDVVMANYGKAFGNPAHAKAVQIALGKIRKRSFESEYANAHMERGHEQEPVARRLYEETQFVEVTNGGYFTLGDDIGVSPDGRVDDDGIIEIKSRIASIHYETVKLQRFPPGDKWQLAFNLKVSGREWIDYVEYCAEFPEGKKLFIQRLYAKDLKKEFDMIDIRLKEFFKLVSDKTAVIQNIEN